MWYHLLESQLHTPGVLGKDSENLCLASGKYRLHVLEIVKELVICVTHNNACHHMMYDSDAAAKPCPGLRIGNGSWGVFESSSGIMATDACLDPK